MLFFCLRIFLSFAFSPKNSCIGKLTLSPPLVGRSTYTPLSYILYKRKAYLFRTLFSLYTIQYISFPATFFPLSIQYTRGNDLAVQRRSMAFSQDKHLCGGDQSVAKSHKKRYILLYTIWKDDTFYLRTFFSLAYSQSNTQGKIAKAIKKKVWRCKVRQYKPLIL